ncbi:MAG: gas vesicle protein GvpN [Cyanobacteria bacterium J007]|nr:MAG: gas vesicle protein GvpN [Cyanobacteria bacterium J007]
MFLGYLVCFAFFLLTIVLQTRPKGFVNTPFIDRLVTRSLRYLRSGFSIHLRGPAGTGKTTLALHLADLLNRPTVLIFGDEQLKSSDLIGTQSGYHRKQVVDRFIHSVVKIEDEFGENWLDSRLTLACREGFTLVYDEFNRSRPEVNNVLLSALEEKLLVLPPNIQRSEYVRVHPEFRVIFTSNPAEYCGIHDTQDALVDRLVTIELEEPDELSEIEMLVCKYSFDRRDAETIVRLVKRFHQETESDKTSGLRSALAIAKICQVHDIPIRSDCEAFRDLCGDVLLSRAAISLSKAQGYLDALLDRLTPEMTGENADRAADIPVKNQPESPRKSPEEAIAPTVAYELEIYDYLQHHHGVRVSAIESALGIDRVEAVRGLRSLIQKGLVVHKDARLYVSSSGLD